MSAPRSLRVRVVEVIIETEDARSFVLEPLDGKGFDYRPGQFVTINVPTDRAGGAARCYSLCSSPDLGEKPKVTVKRTVDGYGSNWLCDNVTPGTELEVLKPTGTFTPNGPSGDFLLFAGGSGITPVMSILKSALHRGSGSVTVVYANRNEESVIFRDELIALTGEFGDRLHVVHLLESVQSRPSAATLRALASPHTDGEAFICGPAPFMDAVVDVLGGLGMPRERVHVERFVSLESDPFADSDVVVDTADTSGEVVVELDGETRTLAWPESNTLLEVLLAAGMDAPFSCKEGACSACACRVVSGEVSLDHNEVLEQEDLDDGIILGCQARRITERVEISYE